ncbi:pyridoxal phosphate-dependent aminotransferase [Catenuloplanes indicus]|uniref:Aminotransferase n=1 Tax=Catenuloplanes indicus TaxID=137267 RepID=A0AAE3VXN8_9ACTN|nr:pyridoxal phosphate-dependent aminotransferase [Catenuloplanes indicus]MDQ0364915.1 aspartate aminotransferase [Catenuloplanes indicus]
MTALAAPPRRWRTSPNLAINEMVARRRAAGEQIVHLGFGEARLPASEPLLRRLVDGAGRNTYGPVAGTPELRAAVAGYFGRRRLATDPEQVVAGPGSKPLLMALNLVLPGDVLLPRPCWNSYAPQAALAGKRAFGVPIPAECGGVPDPDGLRRAIQAARAGGGDPRTLVLTVPDNPTGTVAPPALIRRLCAIAEEEDLLLISDEIYRDLVHDPHTTPVLSPAEVLPERTVIATGLSKSLALGGWRIGVIRVPAGPRGEQLRDGVVSVASEVWSSLAGPMQEVAAYAYGEPPEIRDRLHTCARLHGALARAVHGLLVRAGAECRPPTAGFYVYPDFAPMRATLARRGVTDSASLQRFLLDEAGIAVLGGAQLGDDPAALRFKAATSTLYGETRNEQEAALAAADPAALPHIATVLNRIEAGLDRLCAGGIR